MMRARGLYAVVLSATMALAMAGCGDDDKPIVASDGVTQTTAAAAPATTTTAPPKATVSTANSGLGTILVDTDGRTLYTWDRDTGPTSTCVGNCAATWPPLVLASGATAPVPPAGITNMTATARPDDASK